MPTPEEMADAARLDATRRYWTPARRRLSYSIVPFLLDEIDKRDAQIAALAAKLSGEI